MIKRLLHTTSLKANITANFIGNAWSALIGLLFVPIYLNYIGAEGYGLIGIFASLQVVLSLLDSGLSTTLNKEMSRLSVLPQKEQQMQNLVKTLGNVYWGMALVAGLIALCISPLLARYWVHPVNLRYKDDHLCICIVEYFFGFSVSKRILQWRLARTATSRNVECDTDCVCNIKKCWRPGGAGIRIKVGTGIFRMDIIGGHTSVIYTKICFMVLFAQNRVRTSF